MVEHDLIDLLSLEERSELVSLICELLFCYNCYFSDAFILPAKITDAMRTRLDVVFDSRARKSRLMAMTQRNPNVPQAPQDPRPATPIHLEGPISQTPNVNVIEQEVSTKLVEAKPAALHDFDAWQEALFHRIIEAIFKEEGSKKSGNLKTNQSTGPLPHDSLKHWLPRIDTPLAHTIPSQKAPPIIHAILLLSLSLEAYDPRSRILLLQLCNSFNIPISIMLQQEAATAHILIVSAQFQSKPGANRPALPSNNQLSADAFVKQRDTEGVATRRWKIGLAAAGGALLVGVTGK